MEKTIKMIHDIRKDLIDINNKHCLNKVDEVFDLQLDLFNMFDALDDTLEKKMDELLRLGFELEGCEETFQNLPEEDFVNALNQLHEKILNIKRSLE